MYNDDTYTVRAPKQLVVSLAMMLNPSVHGHCTIFLALNLSIRAGLSVQVILYKHEYVKYNSTQYIASSPLPQYIIVVLLSIIAYTCSTVLATGASYLQNKYHVLSLYCQKPTIHSIVILER